MSLRERLFDVISKDIDGQECLDELVKFVRAERHNAYVNASGLALHGDIGTGPVRETLSRLFLELADDQADA